LKCRGCRRDYLDQYGHSNTEAKAYDVKSKFRPTSS
jgi:transposase-like protein